MPGTPEIFLASTLTRRTGMLECWNARNARMLECQNAGMWNAGMPGMPAGLECQNAGMLECWRDKFIIQ